MTHVRLAFVHQFAHFRKQICHAPKFSVRKAAFHCTIIWHIGIRLHGPGDIGFLIACRKIAGYSASEPSAPRAAVTSGDSQTSLVARCRIAAVWVLSAHSDEYGLEEIQFSSLRAPKSLHSLLRLHSSRHRHDCQTHECQPVNSLKGAHEHLHRTSEPNQVYVVLFE